jgi:hypothetical protein
MVRFLRSWLGTWLAFVAVAMWWALQTLPTSNYWFEASNMLVPDVPRGGDVVLTVEREIKRPVYGDWVVTVRRYENGGWTLACSPSRGSGDYLPKAELPDVLTLEWWTEGQCSISEPGLYFITTTWKFYPRGLPGARRTSPLISNIFSIQEVAG